MAPSLITTQPTVQELKINVKSGHGTAAEAIEAAKARYVERNPASLKLHEEAIKSMPGGNTRTLIHTSPFPVFMKSGKDYQVTSEDGNTYTDLVGELTAALFGHSQPLIQDALISTIKDVGMNLSATTKLEYQHAALLCSRFKLDLIRFTNSGTEANLHAIQAAKHYTGKRKVVVFTGGYHGGCFSFPEDKPTINSVDQHEWVVAEYNDVADAKAKIEGSGDIAAVLVEGLQGSGPAIVGSRDFLQQVQESARKVGAIFVLDEVMTSRLAPGGIQELEGLKPDLTTLGKYLGGGITFGAFGGREDIMAIYDPRSTKGLAHSGTFNNNVLGMAAGYVGISQVYTPEVAIKANTQGDEFRKKLQALSHGTKMTVTGRGTIIGIHFLKDGKKELASYRERQDDHDLKELFWFEMMEDGFWTHKRGYIPLILGTPQEELDRFVKNVGDFLKRHERLTKL
ncbi:pyridoxal phosphate-dependent transferase [Lophiotrema nucula]|uniref:Pyridoxal phosphate-dependent transferase n=1 Tax=Lophiotrema nucula TaxID=690887 RepID=A0A6A5YSG9_9PLEO|nr:pyridoxal phosphate-dependent transferase [Lophiotrema nucula]